MSILLTSAPAVETTSLPLHSSTSGTWREEQVGVNHSLSITTSPSVTRTATTAHANPTTWPSESQTSTQDMLGIAGTGTDETSSATAAVTITIPAASPTSRHPKTLMAAVSDSLSTLSSSSYETSETLSPGWSVTPTDAYPTIQMSTSSTPAGPHNISGVSDVTSLYTNSTISYAEKQAYLDELQAETTRVMIPAMMFLMVLCLVGVVGNSLVLIVYGRKFKRTSTRVYIMTIASFDLVTNVLVIPSEIYDMFHIWDFDQPIICRTRLFFNAFTTIASAIMLVALAVTRYRKICTPFGWQVSARQARVVSCCTALAAFLFAMPNSVINGRHTKSTPRPDVHGYECTIDDAFVGTIWPVINSGIFIALFLSSTIPLVVLYILIGMQAWRHSKVYGVAGAGVSHTRDTTTNTSSGYGNTKSTDGAVTNQDETASGTARPSGAKTKSAGDKDRGDSSTRARRDSLSTVDEANSNMSNGNDDKSVQNNNNDICAHLIRSPTGEKVKLNLGLVKELTFKLKAVKKERKAKDENDDDEQDSTPPQDQIDCDVISPQSNNVCGYDITQSQDKNSCDGAATPTLDEVNISENSRDKKTRRSDCYDSKVEEEEKAIGFPVNIIASGDQSEKPSISSDDEKEDWKEERGKQESSLSGDVPAEGNDNQIREHKKPDILSGDDDIQETDQEDKPLSQFARSMQWVDITYGTKEMSVEGKDEQTVGGTKDRVTKKDSFSKSRKISRDNSFLRKQKQIIETLTDTLTRSKKKKSEREKLQGDDEDRKDSSPITDNHDGMTKDSTDNEPNPQQEEPNKTNVIIVSADNDQHTSDGFGKKNAPRTQRKALSRTTAMLIAITAVYILGFLPFLGLITFRILAPDTLAALSVASLTVYNLFLRSYFLNSAANAIIYSLCDISFRRHCLEIIRCRDHHRF